MIYLDHSATTPLDPLVFKAMEPYFAKDFANPASVHSLGQKALKALDDSRFMIGKILEIDKPSDLIFTSGATEANNLLIKGVVLENLTKLDKKLNRKKGDYKKVHIITTAIEHDSVIEPCRALALDKRVEVTYLPTDKKGIVSVSSLVKALKPNTVLVSIGYVNSEIGVIQPINKLGRALKKYNKHVYKTWLNASTRKRGDKPEAIIFHTDATQAPNYLNCSVKSLLVDAMSLSAHKLYGPKGVGALYFNHNFSLSPLLNGGHQEKNLRSGTVNVPGAIGLATALSLANKKRSFEVKRLKALRAFFLRELHKNSVGYKLNTPLKESVPGHINLSFKKIALSGEALLVALDEKGIAVSTGSACAAGSVSVSRVLKALGLSDKEAGRSIRLTMGRLTGKKEIIKIVAVLKRLQRLKNNHSTK